MGCQKTKCRLCPTSVKACQMVNGLCPACHAATLKPK